MYAYVPNAITLSRFLFTALFVRYHVNTLQFVALAFLVLAFLSDWLDGLLARRWGVTSEFGKQLDPYADKVTCWAVMIIIMTTDSLLAWLYLPVAIVIAVYDGGLAVIRLLNKHRKIATNRFAKRKTTLLMVSSGTLYVSLIPGFPLADPAYWIGIGIGWAALWYGLRSVAHYLRGYGWESYIPRPLNLL